MRKIITFLSMLFCLFATAQEVTDTMYIYRNDKIIERIPVSKIDSVVFVAPKSPAVPETPTVTYETVDLGLPSGVKWATCNVGATSPEEYGGYYAWGEIEEKDEYSWSTYKWCNGTNDSMTKYCTKASYGTVDNKTVLEPEDDVAHVKWGGNWRMPTGAEQEELLTECTWTWTTLNGVNGYQVTGPNGNSIFLPAAGFREGTDVYGRGGYGYYWSSSLGSGGSNFAYILYFKDSNYCCESLSRCCGLSVRPVCSGTTVPVENYTVSVSSDVNGTVSIEGTDEKSITVSADETVTVTATPADGYKFVGWFVEGVDAPISTDAAYTFAVTANISLVAKFESFVEFINGYGYVDLGLPSGVKWATFNVGATKPEEYGGYYAWGEIEEKSDYSTSTSTTYGKSMSDISGNPAYDVARAKWGGSWRMPTQAEQDELFNTCTRKKTTLNGVNGYLVTGPNGNSIFLPAAGYRFEASLYYDGSSGYYWSSTPSSSSNNDAYRIYFYSGNDGTLSLSRHYGRSVRPVCDGQPVSTEPVYESVDLGLPSGVKWATCNVGATSPEEYGGYYAWGEIEEKYRYSWSTYKWCNGTYDSMTKYCTSASFGTVDNKTVLEPEDDVAHVKWGGSWRMPTTAEQYELLTECTWTWTTLNGVNGYQVTGPNGNSIFLPAAGYRNGTEVRNRGNYGYYWSSSLSSDGSNDAYNLGFNDSYYDWYNSSRYLGQSVRPVCSGTTVPVENYTVSVSSDVNGTVSIEGTDEKSITVSADETVTVTATPADGYKFVGWFVEGVDAPISTYAAYTFAVTANISLVAKFESFVEFINGYGYVDLGLPSGLKWAISNLGAETTEKSGEYLSWSRLYDAVPDDLGDKWRVPTKEDFQELCDNCTWSWITQYGVNGIEFTGSNGHRIFLPAAGYSSGSRLYEFGSAGYYWSSTSYNTYNSVPLLFNHNGYSVTDYMSREYSLSIRLVFSEN